ncbi:head GIN domain-containing protein [Flavobacterium sp.]|uniref:head GIN domain-containing protein n=1 Tax=Flavobacterium sp. TaxID=239 RepID=UPI00261743D1|nr:head GIN domain-containing protein [Flavobacterium sp.]
MRKLTVLLALISISIASAQNWDKEKVKGNGVQTTITRTTESYDKILTEGSFNVELVSGKEGTITIKGDENIISHIVTEVIGNELKVYFEKNRSYNYKQDITITIPFEEISEISFAGSGNMVTKNLINATDFEAKMAGSGDCTLEINAKNIVAKMAGSGNLKLFGTVENLEAKTAGSGDLNCNKLVSQNANVTVAGSGSLEVNCTNNLIAKVAGSGNIQYKGNPKIIDSKVAGSGDISGN